MSMSMWPGRHFKRSEFACKCKCGYNTVDAELITVLEDLRQFCEHTPLIINSGCRCVEHNEKVQKDNNPDYIPYSSRSKHMLGIAADVVSRYKTPQEMYDYLVKKYPLCYGISAYSWGVHIDVRSKKSRW